MISFGLIIIIQRNLQKCVYRFGLFGTQKQNDRKKTRSIQFGFRWDDECVSCGDFKNQSIFNWIFTFVLKSHNWVICLYLMLLLLIMMIMMTTNDAKLFIYLAHAFAHRWTIQNDDLRQRLIVWYLLCVFLLKVFGSDGNRLYLMIS